MRKTLGAHSNATRPAAHRTVFLATHGESRPHFREPKRPPLSGGTRIGPLRSCTQMPRIVVHGCRSSPDGSHASREVPHLVKQAVLDRQDIAASK